MIQYRVQFPIAKYKLGYVRGVIAAVLHDYTLTKTVLMNSGRREVAVSVEFYSEVDATDTLNAIKSAVTNALGQPGIYVTKQNIDAEFMASENAFPGFDLSDILNSGRTDATSPAGGGDEA